MASSTAPSKHAAPKQDYFDCLSLAENYIALPCLLQIPEGSWLEDDQAAHKNAKGYIRTHAYGAIISSLVDTNTYIITIIRQFFSTHSSADPFF